VRGAAATAQHSSHQVLAAEQSRAIEAQIQATHAIPSIASTNLAAHLAPRTTPPA
jgi:hypothetical protein